MMFFTPEGEEIKDIKKFVRMYSEDYFLDNDSEVHVPGLSRCSKDIEDKITSILKNGIESEKDIAKILAWKIGKIKHRQSENDKTFRYHKDWQGEDENHEELVELQSKKPDGIIPLYGKPFKIGKIATYFWDNKQELERLAKENPREFLKRMPNFYRIGSVYMITLLYFMSHGKYPIYDRFAMMALIAILDGTSPEQNNKEIDYLNLPDKPDKPEEIENYLNEISKSMNKYIGMLNTIFGEEWKTDRRIDQALWVYGHLFKKGNGKNSNCC